MQSGGHGTVEYGTALTLGRKREGQFSFPIFISSFHIWSFNQSCCYLSFLKMQIVRMDSIKQRISKISRRN